MYELGTPVSRMKSSKESKTEPLLPPPPPPMDPSTTSNDSDKAWVISSDEEGKPDQHIDNDDPFSLTDRNSNIIDGDISTSTQDINWDNDKISSSPEQEMNTYYDAAKTNNISNHSDNGHEFEYRMENDFDGGDLDNEAINLRASNKSSVDDWDEHDIDGIEYYLHKIDNNNIDSTSSTIKQHLDTHINSDDNSSNLDIPKDDFYILGDTDKVIRDEHLDKYSNMTGDDNNVDDKTNLHSDKENELDHDLKLGGDDQQTDIDEISNNAPIDKPNVNKGSDISNIIDTADIDKELDMDDNNNAPSIDYATDRSLALDNMNIVDTHDSNTNGTTDSSITITKKDQKRLAPSQYLNDSVIDFYLKCTWERKAIAETTHIFSTLFYNRLTQGMGQPIAYENVRKWTTNTDLFDKKYAVFPINEKLHWYLVIVCNLDRCIPNQTKDATDSDIWNMPSDSKSNDASNRYMEMEAFTRRHVEKIDFVTPKFRYAHVPMQDNTCDCGVYLLHFVDLFLNSPQEFVETLLNNDTDNLIWQEDKIKEKRKELEGLFKRVHKQYTDTYGTDPVM
ncbi:hypothetical protein BC941DRAFT_452629 [Chlamydoabsidia padenii]|nr:hypothetical protein BC941DRAFT_452629 [Chlamydoabsidia padenii]